jgi:hypothetical protein
VVVLVLVLVLVTVRCQLARRVGVNRLSRARFVECVSAVVVR